MFRMLFYLAANFIMTFIELPFNYTNGFELLFGYIITSSILSILNYAFYKIAYSCVGWYAAITDANYEEKSCLHWVIRFIFAILLYIFTYIPFISKILTYITHFFYQIVINKYNESMQRIIEIFNH